MLVLFAEMPEFPGLSSQPGMFFDIKLGLGGVGWYFCGGQSEPVRWKKQSPEHVLEIVDSGGFETPVLMNPGTTSVAMADVELAVEFSYGTDGEVTPLTPTH